MSRRKTLLRMAMACLVMLILVGSAALVATSLSRVGMFQGYAPVQPIAYSHALHAGDYEIPCLYCHFGAEKSRHAGIPPLSVCMNCHGQIKKRTTDLARLKLAVAEDRPIEWVKVHNLPDFVFFSHRQHVGGGVQCQECHGPVETMVQMRQYAPLTMGWCLDCHKRRGVTEFTSATQVASGDEPAATGRERAIGGMDCTKCHY